MKSKSNTVWKMLDDLTNKKGITEVIINGPDRVFIEKDDQFFHLNVSVSKEEAYQFISDVALFNKKEVNQDHPIMDGRLQDGSRINIVVEPFASGYPAITIRKYLKKFRSFSQDSSVFGLDDKWVELMKHLVLSRTNIVVSGGTGVGKTTFLNMLLEEIPRSERVITIEDTRELNVENPNSVTMETTSGNALNKTIISLRDLIKSSLRMRPDRIIVGEVRGGEIFDLLQAMNTGHEGSITSIHSNNPAECLSRIETLYLMAGFDVPIKAIRRQICSAVDIIVQIGRDRNGKRVVQNISELSGMEQDTLLLNEFAKLQDGGLKSTGTVPSCMSKLIDSGLTRDFFN